MLMVVFLIAWVGNHHPVHYFLKSFLCHILVIENTEYIRVDILLDNIINDSHDIINVFIVNNI